MYEADIQEVKGSLTHNILVGRANRLSIFKARQALQESCSETCPCDH